jgi:hypothetical protein
LNFCHTSFFPQILFDKLLITHARSTFNYVAKDLIAKLKCIIKINYTEVPEIWIDPRLSRLKYQRRILQNHGNLKRNAITKIHKHWPIHLLIFEAPSTPDLLPDCSSHLKNDCLEVYTKKLTRRVLQQIPNCNFS